MPWKVLWAHRGCAGRRHEVVNEAQEAHSFLNRDVATDTRFARLYQCCPDIRAATGLLRWLAQPTQLIQKLGKLMLGACMLALWRGLGLRSHCHVQQASYEVLDDLHHIQDVQLVSHSAAS